MSAVKPPAPAAVEGGPLARPGTAVWSRGFAERGVTLGWSPREYTGEAGYSLRYAVRWPDGDVTWPCEAGLAQDAGGHWFIR